LRSQRLPYKHLKEEARTAEVVEEAGQIKRRKAKREGGKSEFGADA